MRLAGINSNLSLIKSLIITGASSGIGLVTARKPNKAARCPGGAE
jgi:NADP-dependent 3-hydroxy acid dehydrogenase YdfG